MPRVPDGAYPRRDNWDRTDYYQNNRWQALEERFADDGGNPGNIIVTYRFDGTGRRIQKLLGTDPENPDTSYDYYYNNSWQCLEVRKDGIALADLYEQYIWSLRYTRLPGWRQPGGQVDAPILRDENTDADGLCDDDRMYYLQDANFNVTALVTDAGAIQERYVYDPYGRVAQMYSDDWSTPVAWGSSKKNEVLYCGYRFDPETRMYCVRERYYHPTLGRWVQRDLIGYADGMNLYEYVGSAPVVDSDPQGRGGDEKEESTKELCLCFCVEHLKFEEIKHIQPRKTRQQSGFVGAAFNVELKGVWKKWKKRSLGKFNLEWFEWFIMKAKGQRGKAYKWNEYFLSGVHPEASVFDMVRWTGWHLRELRWKYERMEAMGATEFKMYYYMADQPGVSVMGRIPTYHQVSFWAIRVSSTPGCDCRISEKTIYAKHEYKGLGIQVIRNEFEPLTKLPDDVKVERATYAVGKPEFTFP